MKGKCECGADRPYRRAYKCLKCWQALNGQFVARLIGARKTKNDGPGTLGLRRVLDRG